MSTIRRHPSTAFDRVRRFALVHLALVFVVSCSNDAKILDSTPIPTIAPTGSRLVCGPVGNGRTDVVQALLRSRLDAFGDVSFTTTGGRVTIEMPRAVTEQVAAAICRPPRFELRPVLATAGPGSQPAGSVVTADAGTFAGADRNLVLGPAAVSGASVTSAKAVARAGAVVVDVELADDALARFNDLARRCSNADDSCPTSQIAIVFDDRVISAPRVQAPSFSATLQISSLSTAEATLLVDSLDGDRLAGFTLLALR